MCPRHHLLGGTGLPAREPEGVPVAPVPDLSLIFFFSFKPPSEASPAVASPSLVAPPTPLGRPGSGVAERLGIAEAVALPILTFFLDDSLPLDSERLGEPGRFSFPFLTTSRAFCFPEGVVDPLDAAPETADSPFLASSSFLTSSSLASESDSDSYDLLTCVTPQNTYKTYR